MNEQERLRLAAYIADYVSEEIIRGNTDIDRWMVLAAINSYLGGAAEDRDNE